MGITGRESSAALIVANLVIGSRANHSDGKVFRIPTRSAGIVQGICRRSSLGITVRYTCHRTRLRSLSPTIDFPVIRPIVFHTAPPHPFFTLGCHAAHRHVTISPFLPLIAFSRNAYSDQSAHSHSSASDAP